MSRPIAEAKHVVRRPILEARRRRSPEARDAVEQALAAHLIAVPSLVRARRVAAYRSMADEPGTGAFVDALAARGVTVLLPLTLDDGGLAWVEHDPAAATRRSRLGVEEQVGPALGSPASGGSVLDTVDVVVLPALAADHAGRRLGRGAGYYDRALAGLARTPRPLLVTLVHADELLPEVPHEPHDVPVDMVVTETGVFRVPHPD